MARVDFEAAYEVLLVNFWWLARKADYKKREFSSRECQPAKRYTVTLCSKCVGTNQLGNIIYGIIAFDMGLVGNAINFGNWEAGWRQPGQAYRQQAFDIGVEYAALTRLHPNIDLCDLMNRNTRGDVDQGNKGIPPCKGKFDGAHTDFTKPPLTDPLGR
jgi:hypothetical protein